MVGWYSLISKTTTKWIASIAKCSRCVSAPIILQETCGYAIPFRENAVKPLEMWYSYENTVAVVKEGWCCKPLSKSICEKWWLCRISTSANCSSLEIYCSCEMARHCALFGLKHAKNHWSSGDHVQLLDSRERGSKILISLFVKTWSSIILRKLVI